MVQSSQGSLGLGSELADEISVLVAHVHGDELWAGRLVKSFEGWVKKRFARQASRKEPADISFGVERVGSQLEDLDQNGPLQMLPWGSDT